MKSLGAFYQVYNNKPAARHVLGHFKQCFPNSPVVLISDGGEDFSDVAHEYGCFYTKRHNIVNNFINPCNAAQMREWWFRQKLTTKVCKTDYVILLEDDVYIQQSFEIKEDFHLRGVRCGNAFSPMMLKDISDSSPILHHTNDYGMCGGSIYNTASLLSVYSDVVREIKERHDNLLSNSQYYLLGVYDANIVYHFNKRGYTYEQSPWLGEVLRNPGYMNYPIIHQYKKF